MEISAVLRDRRHEIGKTQEQVAREAGMNVTQYNGYERGRSVPSMVTIPRLAVALQTTTEALQGRGAVRPRIGENKGDVLRSLREQFRAQIAVQLDLNPSDITIQVTIL